MTKNKWLSRVTLSCALVGGMALASVGTARADDEHRECERRLEGDRARVDRDISRHGEHSHQVDHDIAKMDADRSWCREHKWDWDHDKYDRDNYMHH
jgi:hypothetical protein